MLLQFSMIILTSQLVVAVADGPPKFDIARGCKVDSASAFDPKAGMSATIKRCMDDEQRAKDQLETNGRGSQVPTEPCALAKQSEAKPTTTPHRRATLIC